MLVEVLDRLRIELPDLTLVPVGRRRLGWRPLFDLEGGRRRAIDWYRRFLEAA